jgi:hypothetical protein
MRFSRSARGPEGGSCAPLEMAPVVRGMPTTGVGEDESF